MSNSVILPLKIKFTFDHFIVLSLAVPLSVLLFLTITGFPENISANHDHQLFSGNTNPILDQVEISQLSKSKDMEGDAKSIPNSFRVYEGYIDTENHCEFCTRIEYTPDVQGMGGMAYFDEKGHDLVGAKRITFYLMGIEGDAKVKFMIAGKKLGMTNTGLSNQPFDGEKFGVITKTISLSKDWKKLEVDVSKIDLTNINYPFALEVIKTKGSGNVAFYLKYIAYDSQNTKNPLSVDIS